MSAYIDENSYEGGDGGSSGQGSPSPDRDRPEVATETGETQGQGASFDQEPEAPLTPEEAEAFEDRERANDPDGPARDEEAPLTPEEAEAFENREHAGNPEGSMSGERMSPPSDTPSWLADRSYLNRLMPDAAQQSGPHGVDYRCTKDGDYVPSDEVGRGPSPVSRPYSWEAPGIDPSTGEKFAQRPDFVPPPDNLRQDPGIEGLPGTFDVKAIERRSRMPVSVASQECSATRSVAIPETAFRTRRGAAGRSTGSRCLRQAWWKRARGFQT